MEGGGIAGGGNLQITGNLSGVSPISEGKGQCRERIVNTGKEDNQGPGRHCWCWTPLGMHRKTRMEFLGPAQPGVELTQTNC